jgi:poly(A) polymerase
MAIHISIAEIHLSSRILIGQILIMDSPKKFNRVHHTAIAVVPPDEDAAVWEQLHDIRYRRRDKGFYRWPPHVNFVYPFVDVPDMEIVVPNVCAALAGIQPFDVTLSDFGVFGGKRSGVCWLSPEPLDKLCNIYATLECCLNLMEGESERSCRPFQPHMTVSHYASKQPAVAAADEERLRWSPVSFPLRELHVISRDSPDGQFSVMWRIPLGGGEPVYEGGKRYEHMPTEEPDWVRDIRTGGKRKGSSKKS